MLLLLPQHRLRNIFSHRVLVYTLAVLDEMTVFCIQDNWTALHLAAQKGIVDVVNLLTQAKAHVNIKTKVH